MWELLRVCAACPTPGLNWSSSSVPPRTTSTKHSPPGPHRIQHIIFVMCQKTQVLLSLDANVQHVLANK
jgi:hypothetical protein